MPTRTRPAATPTPKKTPKTPPAKKAPAPRARKAVAAVPTPAAPATPKASARSGVDKPAKAKRVALVRDGFTMPESDFALIATLKARALAARREAKKSELLRAGLQALAQLDGAALVQALNRLEPIKTGRPKKG